MRRRSVALLVVWLWASLASPGAPVQAQAPCGGVERWAVKVAADPGAALIDFSNPITTSLHDLVAIPRPQLPPGNDETTRLADERAVHIVEGRLLKLKRGGTAIWTITWSSRMTPCSFPRAVQARSPRRTASSPRLSIRIASSGGMGR